MDTLASALPQKAASPIAAPISLVSQESGVKIPPQVNPNIMPYLKPTTSQLSITAAAGTSSKPISKPASTAPVDIDPQTQAHADTLARHGIKVRDFAFESKLPPVRPFRVRQIQPGPRPLKRVREDEDDDVFYNIPKAGQGEGSSSKKSKLEREITEPDIQQSSSNPVRARGFLDLNDYEPEDLSQPQSQSQSIPFNSQQSEWEASQPPSRFLESQDSEPYIDTPLVTPNGSLQWKIKNTSEIPASQLDTESQAPELELLSYFQLGMPQPDDITGTGLFGDLTPMSSLSSIASEPPASPQRLQKDLHPHTPRHAPQNRSPLRSSPHPRSSNKSPALPKPATPPAPTSRYHLRKRPAPKSPQSPTKAGTRSRRTMYSAAHPLSRPAYSMQSSHSRAKPQAGSGSPHSRTLRQRAAGPSSREETIITR